MDDADRAQMVEEAERERAVPEQFREQLAQRLKSPAPARRPLDCRVRGRLGINDLMLARGRM